MGEVISMNSKRSAGGVAFAVCPCTDEGTIFATVVMPDEGMLVVALQCPECDVAIPVVNGYLGEQE